MLCINNKISCLAQLEGNELLESHTDHSGFINSLSNNSVKQCDKQHVPNFTKCHNNLEMAKENRMQKSN